jgi:hypothetical protein
MRLALLLLSLPLLAQVTHQQDYAPVAQAILAAVRK